MQTMEPKLGIRDKAIIKEVTSQIDHDALATIQRAMNRLNRSGAAPLLTLRGIALALIVSQPGCTLRDLSDITMASHSNVSRAVSGLVSDGLVTRVGPTISRNYVANMDEVSTLDEVALLIDMASKFGEMQD